MRNNTRAHWQQLVDRAIAITDNNLSRDLSITAVADQLCVDAQTLSRRFEDLKEESFKQFTKRRKLENAGGLLRHSPFSISQIAERCGYNNIYSFSKAFAEEHELSPTAYRDRLYLPNELATLNKTQIITSSPETQDDIFCMDNLEEIQENAATLYYTILPSQHDPIRNMVAHMLHYIQQFRIIRSTLMIPDARIITGTLDAVPVVAYEKMMMYVGLQVPNNKAYEVIHRQIKFGFQTCHLLQKEMEACNYKFLKVNMGFADAGLPMYNFINKSCRQGFFKMNSNLFYMSLTGLSECEIFIPWERRYSA